MKKKTKISYLPFAMLFNFPSLPIYAVMINALFPSAGMLRAFIVSLFIYMTTSISESKNDYLEDKIKELEENK